MDCASVSRFLRKSLWLSMAPFSFCLIAPIDSSSPKLKPLEKKGSFAFRSLLVIQSNVIRKKSKKWDNQCSDSDLSLSQAKSSASHS